MSDTNKVQCILHISNHIPFFSLEVAKSYDYSLDFPLSHVVLLYIIIYVSEDVLSLYPVKPSKRSFYQDDVKHCVNG